MEKTYSADQIRRMREAYATITELESLKRAVPDGPHRHERVRTINERIEQWYTTVEFIKEEE